MDLGIGKNLDLEQCPRSKLKKQCIKYLGPVCASLIWMCVYFKCNWIWHSCFFDKLLHFYNPFSSVSYFPKLARERTVWIHCTWGHSYQQATWRFTSYKRKLWRCKMDICIEHLKEILCWPGNNSSSVSFLSYIFSLKTTWHVLRVPLIHCINLVEK